MTVTRHSYAGNAPDSTLNGGINASVLTIVIADGTGWPTGSNGPFVIDIDNGESAYEKVLIDSRSGATLTVNASGRGWDDTSGATHATAATVRHVLSAAEIEELNAHAANALHPHTAAGLDTDSVTTAKILDGNVTNAKLAATGLDIAKFTTGTSDRDTTGNAATATTAATWTTARDLTFSGDVTGTLSSVDGSATVDAAMTIAADSIEQSMMSLTWTLWQWTSETTQVTQNEVAINTDGSLVYMELGALGIISGRVSFNATGATGAIKVDVPGTGATSSAQYMNGSFRLAVPGASHCGQVSGNVADPDYFRFLQHDTASDGTSLPAVGNTSVLDFWATWVVG